MNLVKHKGFLTEKKVSENNSRSDIVIVKREVENSSLILTMTF